MKKNVRSAVKTKVTSRYSKAMHSVLEGAFIVARKMKASSVMPKHVFVSILLRKNTMANFLLKRFKIDARETVKRISGFEPTDLVQKTRPSSSRLGLHPSTQELLFNAAKIARESNGYYIGTEHALLALFGGSSKDLSFVKELLKKVPSFQGFANEVLHSVVLPFQILRQAEEGDIPTVKPLPNIPHESGQNVLTLFTEHLTNKDRKFDPIISRYKRKKLTDQILTILMRSKNRNVMLVGPSGSGKSHVIDELSFRFVNGDVPVSTIQQKILKVNIPAMASVAKFPSDIEKNVMAVLNEAFGVEDIVLLIEDFMTIIAPHIRGGLNMRSTLKTFLDRNNMNIIVTITPEELKSLEDNFKGILRFFSIIKMPELGIEEAGKLLKDAIKQLEKDHNVDILPEAVDSVVSLTTQYIQDRVLPEKAIEILDLAASKKKFSREYKYKELGELQNEKESLRMRKDRLVSLGEYADAEGIQEKLVLLKKEISDMQKRHRKETVEKKLTISASDIKEIVSEWTKLPISTVSTDETSMLLQLEDRIKELIISQQDAITRVVNAVKRGRVGISSKKRPWTSLLFLGPTGVGKTELAKVLAKSLFGDEEDRLIQIDMSEYMEQHSVSKLIGSPPGYVGYDQGGWLTEEISKHPHSVVLFDEIEKAHPDVLNILLQILEDGHLMDAKGERVNFRNTIVILTSNIGAEKIAEDKVLGFYRDKRAKDIVSQSTEAYEEMKEKLNKELRKKLRPELLNRLDDIIIFKGLAKKDASNVLDILISDLNARLKSMNMAIDISNRAKDYILEKGFSVEYGARPLRRVLQHDVENIIADYVLEKGLLNKKKEDMVNLEVDVERKKLIIV